MMERPPLSRDLDADTFCGFYWLKEELIDFCRANKLPVSGGKADLAERIAAYLRTGEVLLPQQKPVKKPAAGVITEETQIEPDFVCSEKHRAFFKEKIGKRFSFNVPFQTWLKTNTGKTYAQAIKAYDELLAEKKKGKTAIDQQFEYNTYIRDFFADNPGRSLQHAILCWKYKKSIQGHNTYEKSDLAALNH